MDASLIEPQKMGRPRRTVGTVSMKIEEDAHDMARKASGFTGESIVQYISRVVREQAEKDVRAGAEEFLRQSDARKKAPPKR